MTNQNNNHSKAEDQLDAFMSSEVTQYAKWTDTDGKKHSEAIKVEDPGIGVATQALDLLNVGDDESNYTDLFGLIMTNVLDDPSYTYDQLDKDFPKEEAKRSITKKNKDGETVHIGLVFPGYRKAIQIVMGTSGASGRSRMYDTLQTLNEEVLRQEDGQIANMEYWEPGSHANGLGMVAYNEAMGWLSEILLRDGLMPKLTAAMTFLFNTVRPAE